MVDRQAALSYCKANLGIADGTLGLLIHVKPIVVSQNSRFLDK